MKKIVSIILVVILGGYILLNNMRSEKVLVKMNLDLSSMADSMLIATAASCMKIKKGIWPDNFEEISGYLSENKYSFSSQKITEYFVKEKREKRKEKREKRKEKREKR